MYGLPPDFKPDIFIGRSLEGILLGEYVVQFIFDGDVSVHVESKFLLNTGSGEWVELDIPVMSAEVTSLLGKSVIGADADAGGELKLVFESRSGLQFSDNNAPFFESYQIQAGEQSVIV